MSFSDLPPPPPPPFPPPSFGITKTSYDLWFVGIFIYILGTLFQALGANLQRYSAVQSAAEKDGGRSSVGSSKELPVIGAFARYYQRPLTVIGVFLFASGGIICSVALVFADESLIAPLVLILFIFNPLFAHVLNREPFDWATDGVLTLAVMVGVGLVEGFSPHTSASYTVEYIEYLFRQSTFIGFSTVVVGLIAIMFILQHQAIQRARLKTSSPPPESGFVQVSHGAHYHLCTCPHPPIHATFSDIRTCVQCAWR